MGPSDEVSYCRGGVSYYNPRMRMVTEVQHGAAAQHVFATLNGWTTGSRFSDVNLCCKFCPYDISGGVNHLIICHSLQNFILRSLRQSHIFIAVENIFLFRNSSGTLPLLSQYSIGVYTYLAFCTYNIVRHGTPLSDRLITHLLNRLCFHCNDARSFIRFLKRHQLDW